MDERARLRQYLLAVAGVILIAAAVAIVRNRAEVRAAQPAPAPAVSDGASLSVQHDGPALRVRWDPQAQAVRAATRAVLVITDGTRESRMELNRRELGAGLASYWPDSQNVAFRLELDNRPAPVVQAPPVAAERPSPFVAPERPRRRPAPIKRVQAVPAPQGPSIEEPVKRPSRISRAVGKIPLLRRLRKHRD